MKSQRFRIRRAEDVFFDSIDKDNDQFVNRRDVLKGMLDGQLEQLIDRRPDLSEHLGSPARVAKTSAAMAPAAVGLHRTEFKAMIRASNPARFQVTNDVMQRIFKIIDEDDSGLISKKDALLRMSESDVQQVLIAQYEGSVASNFLPARLQSLARNLTPTTDGFVDLAEFASFIREQVMTSCPATGTQETPVMPRLPEATSDIELEAPPIPARRTIVPRPKDKVRPSMARQINSFLGVEIMPLLHEALTKLSVQRPDDHYLWLSNFFLRKSEAGDRYELRRKLSTHVSNTQLHPGDIKALHNAADAKGLRATTDSSLRPLHPWERRLQRCAGVFKDASVQAEPSSSEVAVQVTTKVTSAGSQTMLSSSAALEKLQSDARAWFEHLKDLRAEERAIRGVFERILTSGGAMQKLLELYKIFDPRDRGFITSTSVLRGISKNVKVIRLLLGVPDLRPLLRPRLWRRVFAEISGELEGDCTAKRMSQRTFMEYVMSRVSVTRQELMTAVLDDPVLQAVIRWSEALHPLLKPRQFARVFESIDRSKLGRITFADFVIFMRESRQGAREDARADAVVQLFQLLSGEANTVGVSKRRLLRVLSGTSGNSIDEQASAVIQWSAALRPLMVPGQWMQVFDDVDADRDGVLSREEFFAFIAKSASQNSALAKIEAERQERTIELRAAENMASLTLKKLRDVFDAIDVQHTGYVYRQNLLLQVLDDEGLKESLRSMGPLKSLLKPSTWVPCFSRIDTDRDGRLNFGEFSEFCCLAYAADLSQEEQASRCAISVLTGIAMGARAVGATIKRLDQHAVLQTLTAARSVSNRQLESAVTEAVAAAAPPAWRLDMAAANRAATKIQALYRGADVRMWHGAVARSIEYARMSEFAATMIQAAWRGFWTRISPVVSEEELWFEVLDESAARIQRWFRACLVRTTLGIGRRKREGIWVCVTSFQARSADELDIVQGDVLWLHDEVVDPVQGADGIIVGWYRAVQFHDEQAEHDPMATSLSGAKLVPSTCVRPATKTEKEQAKRGRLPVWIKLMDPRSGRFYYYNNMTGESTFDEPPGFRPPRKTDVLRGLHMSPDVRAAVLVQQAFRAKQARQKARGMKAANLMETAVAGWIMMTEERTARNYWVHVDTGEITWEKPTEVAEREAQMADQAMKAAREAAAASKQAEQAQRLEEEQQQQRRVQSRLSDDVVEVNFTQPSFGLELVGKKTGGAMIHKVTEECQHADKLLRGMVLLRIGDTDVRQHPLAKVLNLLKLADRPVQLNFVRIKHLRLAQEAARVESAREKGRREVVIEFGVGPMGIEFVPRRKKHGAIVKSLIEGGQALQNHRKRLRRGMQLARIGPETVVDWSFGDIMRALRREARPTKLQFLTAPSRPRSRSPQGRSPPRRKRPKTPQELQAVFDGPGGLGLELCSRKKGGVLIKAVVPDSAAAEKHLRRGMLLLQINGVSVKSWALPEVITRLACLPRPLTLTFASAPSRR